MMKHHWVKNDFFIFLTFERDTTNYRGTLVENVKKVKKSTHPTDQPVKTDLEVSCQVILQGPDRERTELR
jgi:hypothetical protein